MLPDIWIEQLDCKEMIQRIPEHSVDLVLTSPPYNIKRGYKDYTDSMKTSEYLDWLAEIFFSCKRILKVGGRLAINIPNISFWGREPTGEILCSRLTSAYLYRDTIIWSKMNTSKRTAWGSWKSPSNPYTLPSYEFILLFSNESYKLDHKGTPDITSKEFVLWTWNPWSFKGETRKSIRQAHPAAFPLELPVRLIKFLTYPGDTVFDPFLGSGTTLAACQLLGRKGIGCDIDPAYIAFSKNRLTDRKLLREDKRELVRCSIPETKPLTKFISLNPESSLEVGILENERSGS